MILGILFYEFFKIGLFAIGGGLVTIPFLFELAKKYDWFTVQELTDMIAVSQSTPGPVGVNMATYAGFKTAGLGGGCFATLGLVLPSLIIVIIVARILSGYAKNPLVLDIMTSVRPATVALILVASVNLFNLSVENYFSLVICGLFFGLIYFYKQSPIFYIILSAVVGAVLKL